MEPITQLDRITRKQSRSFCRVHEGNEKYLRLSKRRRMRRNREDEPSSSQKRRREWSRYTSPFFLFVHCGSSRGIARRDERGIRRRTKERAKKIRVERRRPAWGIGTIPGRKRRMQEARHGNNKIICHWPICIRRSRVPWRQACKVQLNEPSLNIVWKITSVTRILLPPPLLPARLSLSFKWILLARHAWLVDSFLLLFLFFFSWRGVGWKRKSRVESRELLHLPIWLYVLLNLA